MIPNSYRIHRKTAKPVSSNEPAVKIPTDCCFGLYPYRLYLLLHQ